MADRETDLMLQVKTGDAAAFEELYGLYRRPLANFLYRLCWNRQLVDDLMQDVFLRLWRAAPNYEPSAKVSTYVFRIAHNLWINEGMKRREQAVESIDRAGRSDPSEGLERGEVQAAVKKAIEELPEGERECLVLSEYNGLKYAEISEILGVPVGTVKSRIWSAVQRLREKLKGLRA
ncbi:MAG: sigma-70 family RNA polymerase sigma factor [Planctomycetes bacterium]|nr:sigma-70 family RNA polymerase sigma factor [Planctomycetota bacterium]